MKAKGKMKKKEPKTIGMKQSDTEREKSDKSDLSLLRKPIETSLSDLKQVARVLETGSDEVKSILTYECDVIYECRICRSLFRSLANLISHKRVYCQEKYYTSLSNGNWHNGELIYHRDEMKSSDVSTESQCKDTFGSHRVLRSHTVKNYPKKDLTSVVDMLIKKKNGESEYEIEPLEKRSATKDKNQIVLEMIGSKQAAYQTLIQQNITEDVDFMQSQVNELSNMLGKDTAVVLPNGQFLETSGPLQILNQFSDIDEVNMHQTPGDDMTCTYCNMKFATKKTLNFHVKSKHITLPLCYPCPCCPHIFANRWSVLRHLIKVHRKTSLQVRKLRPQIRPFKKTEVDTEPTKIKLNKSIEEKTQQVRETAKKSQNSELYVELQRCDGCGKRFERKAALTSHLGNCHKRVSTMESQETFGDEEPRKIPSQLDLDKPETPTIDLDENEIMEIQEHEKIKTTNVNEESVTGESSTSKMKPDQMAIVPKVNMSAIIQSIPPEISIRVEGVSTLSNDVWEKMGTSEEVSENSSTRNEPPDGQFKSSMLEEKSLENNFEFLNKENNSEPVTDVPDLIYTSIDNSRPVNLSVLGTEKKLGIQYRGIRLPTVTLEKIVIPKDSSPEKLQNPETIAPKIRKKKKKYHGMGSGNFPCSTCGRRYKSMGSLQRHIVLHIKRKSYRCKICNEFRSVVKCQVVAHCNTVHQMKNKPGVVADFVLEELLGEADSEERDCWKKDLAGGSSELEFIDVNTSSKSEINIGKIVNKEKSLTTGSPVAPLIKRKRGRKKKRKNVARTIALRHVSPPRLTDQALDENGVTSEVEISVEGDDRSTLDEATPMKMDTDDNLRKMVMEVIFGTSQEEQNSSDKNDNNSNDVKDTVQETDCRKSMDKQIKSVNSVEPLRILEPDDDDNMLVEVVAQVITQKDSPNNSKNTGPNNNSFSPKSCRRNLKNINSEEIALKENRIHSNNSK